MRGIVVVCVRDPDASNDFRTFGAEEPVRIIDLDLGRSDLSDADEFREWAEGHLATAQEMRTAGDVQVAAYVESVVSDVADSHDHAVPVLDGVPS